MRKLIIFMFTLGVLLTAGVGSAVAVGHLRHSPEQVQMLHLQDCSLPCWIGIIPGKTRMNEALHLITEVYGKIPGYNISSNGHRILLENSNVDINIVVLPDGFDQDDIVELV